MALDVLAFAAHPDDVELGCGGSIAKLTAQGYSVGICDLTRGELGSRGTPERRAEEAEKASVILGIKERVNLGISDGNITINDENIRGIASVLRYYTPQLILIPPKHDRHIDHENAHQLLRKAVFASGMAKIDTLHDGTSQESHRPKYMFAYMQTYHFEPDFIMDITEYYEQKKLAIHAFSSQIYVPDNHDASEPKTFISSPAFMEMLESRARYFGGQIGVKYGEGFQKIEPIGLSGFDIWLK